MKRNRQRAAASVSEFLSAVSPGSPMSWIEAIVARLSDEQLMELDHAIFRQAMGDNMRYAAKVCSTHGWFLDMEFPGAPAPDVADLYEQGDAARADSILAAYYHKRSRSVQSELGQLYPERAKILDKAFRMHFDGEYDASVPLFLIQADGICDSIFDTGFFRIKHNALAARRAVDEKRVDWAWDALAEPFRISLPIAAHRRTAKFLNRHLVLHGKSLDYGTEMNSLKAISLLSFLWGLDDYARDKERRDTLVEASIEDLPRAIK